MRLAEEYLKRHNFDIPLVRYVEQGTIFLRDDSENQTAWEMLRINFGPDPNSRSGPSVFTIRRNRPIYNGYNRKSLFEQVAEEIIQWDEYEDYLLAYSRRPGQLRAIRDTAEIYLVAWEMFVYNHADALSLYANNNSFFESLDTSLGVVERHQAYSKFTQAMAMNQPPFFEDWSKDMLQHVRIYCHWLAKIMGQNGVSN